VTLKDSDWDEWSVIPELFYFLILILHFVVQLTDSFICILTAMYIQLYQISDEKVTKLC